MSGLGSTPAQVITICVLLKFASITIDSLSYRVHMKRVLLSKTYLTLFFNPDFKTMIFCKTFYKMLVYIITIPLKIQDSVGKREMAITAVLYAVLYIP